MKTMTTHPTIAEAKALAQKHRKCGVIILHFDASGQFGTASFGWTRAMCDEIARVSDRLHELATDGTLFPTDEAP